MLAMLHVLTCHKGKFCKEDEALKLKITAGKALKLPRSQMFS